MLGPCNEPWSSRTRVCWSAYTIPCLLQTLHFQHCCNLAGIYVSTLYTAWLLHAPVRDCVRWAPRIWPTPSLRPCWRGPIPLLPGPIPRLVFPDAASGLSGPEHCTASLSQPLPPHAVEWALEAGQQHVRQLPFRHKLQLLCTAAVSGSEANLEVALALLQPSIFPELLQSYDSGWAYRHVPPTANPGVAAVTAGHPQLLGWLLSHCPGLVERRQVLTAAAKHCDLAGLQAAFGALSVDPAGQGWMRDLVAESATPDAVAKMEWLMGVGGRRFLPQAGTAKAAARSGDLGRLRWLRERGCPVEGLEVVEDALRHADLAVAQWLVDEAGCELPPAVGADNDTDEEDEWNGLLLLGVGGREAKRQVGWGSLLEAAARSPDGVDKVRWLLQRRGGHLRARQWQRMAMAAARVGRVEMVRHALSVLGPGAMPEALVFAAVQSGSVPLVQFLYRAGVVCGHVAYIKAADAGSLAMVRWLACEAGASSEGLDLYFVVGRWPYGPAAATSRELLQAVQLLVDEAGWRDWGDTTGLVKAAANRGDLALVQYLLQQQQQQHQGHQPDWNVVLAAAAEGGCEAVLEWLVEQHPGCLAVPPGDFSLYVFPAVAGDLATLTVLRRLGVPWGAADVVVSVAACYGFAPAALHWLVGQGAPVGSHRDVQEVCELLGVDVDRSIKDWLLGLAEG